MVIIFSLDDNIGEKCHDPGSQTMDETPDVNKSSMNLSSDRTQSSTDSSMTNASGCEHCDKTDEMETCSDAIVVHTASIDKQESNTNRSPDNCDKNLDLQELETETEVPKSGGKKNVRHRKAKDELSLKGQQR